MLYLTVDFESGLTIYALVESGVYVRAIAGSEVERFKQQAPTNILSFDIHALIQKQVAIGQLEKAIATITLIFVIGHGAFA